MSPLKPRIIEKFTDVDLFEALRDETPWVVKGSTPRAECFMALDLTRTYSYGSKARDRTYEASPMHPGAKALMDKINEAEGCAYNVCVLNYYRDEHQHLGWHPDDSPEQDQNHPIAVVSFGASREIWVKLQDYKGLIPPEDRYLLTPGALFIMPVGFQDTHFHKIPKHDRPCGGRISLTFRKLDR